MPTHPPRDYLRLSDTTGILVVCYTAVFSVVTQRSSPLTAVSGEERCVTTLKTAVYQTSILVVKVKHETRLKDLCIV